jgi:hypothetical protein
MKDLLRLRCANKQSPRRRETEAERDREGEKEGVTIREVLCVERTIYYINIF